MKVIEIIPFKNFKEKIKLVKEQAEFQYLKII